MGKVFRLANAKSCASLSLTPAVCLEALFREKLFPSAFAKRVFQLWELNFYCIVSPRFLDDCWHKVARVCDVTLHGFSVNNFTHKRHARINSPYLRSCSDAFLQTPIRAKQRFQNLRTLSKQTLLINLSHIHVENMNGVFILRKCKMSVITFMWKGAFCEQSLQPLKRMVEIFPSTTFPSPATPNRGAVRARGSNEISVWCMNACMRHWNGAGAAEGMS